MSRAIWKGAISFGLVHIPVELYSAVAPNELDLTMLDKRDFSPVGFRRYNKANGKEVVWADIVKGYEYAEDEFVVLSDEDLKQANVKSTQTIDIQSFVDAAELPLTFYEQPYYLAPDKGGDKVYALLRETLRKADKIGIAQIVIRTKQHLAALVVVGDVIVLNTLRYADEMRDTSELDLPAANLKSANVNEKEINMALSLVEGMSEAWNPEQYRDTYRDDVLALVDKKIKAKQTKTITLPSAESEPPRRSADVIDLVELLQQSLRKKGDTSASTVETTQAKAAKSSRKASSTSASSAAPKTTSKASVSKVLATKNSTRRKTAAPMKSTANAAKNVAKKRAAPERLKSA
jgi:DNA end-binding protein Ku